MADRDSIYAWLQGATFRHTGPNERKIIEGLISEGRAEWVNPWNRARAIPNPLPKKRAKPGEASFRSGEVFALKQVVAHLRGKWDSAADLVEAMIAEKETPCMGKDGGT